MTAVCGILNWREQDSEIDKLVRSMLATMSHRGDKSARFFIDREKKISIAAAFKPSELERDMPTNWFEDTNYVSTLDGTIYNQRGLLTKYRSRSSSQAAAIIAAHQGNSPDFPAELDGLFSLALMDKRSGRLWLARDPLGRKPLYYSQLPSGSFVFASEPKALVAKGVSEPTLSSKAVMAYTTFSFVPAPLTLFDGICKLYPGELLTIDSEGAISKHAYWSMPPFTPGDESVEHLAPRIRENLLVTLEKQIQGAKSVGVLLSGGADSTILLGALKILGIKDRHALTLDHLSEAHQIDNREDCEWARSVAARHGATHHSVNVPFSPSFDSKLPSRLKSFDDPVILENRVDGADRLTKEAARLGIAVCLSGNNQKPFGGIWEWKVLSKLLTQESSSRLSPFELLVEANLNLFSVDEQCSLLGTTQASIRDQAAEILREYVKNVEFDDAYDLVAAASILMRSPEEFIPFEERVVIGNDVQICYPFLDPLLLRVANTIPVQLRRGDGSVESQLAALRYAFRDVLPTQVLERRKVAYPRDRWTDGNYHLLIDSLLSTESLARSNVFDSAAVSKLMAAAADRRNIESRRQFWTILFFQLWFDCFIRKDASSRLDAIFV